MDRCMDTKTDHSSLVDYYRNNLFNPVPIDVEDSDVWNTHFAKRRNLYELHLHIPLSLLRDRSVIEFGPNSGENALVLAMVGANLWLVEPNEQVLPRLNNLFNKFGLTGRIKELCQEEIGEFKSEARYDLAIAEGFLYTLPNRDEMLQKLADLLVPGGLGVVSYNDRYGGVIEFTKKLVLWRACQQAHVDVYSDTSLALADSLFGEDFRSLKASRPFAAWWKDTLVNPFIAPGFLWSFREILPTLERAGCEVLSCSPQWSLSDCFAWYKDTRSSARRHEAMLLEWHRMFSFILTGVKPKCVDMEPASNELINSVARLVETISEYTSDTRNFDALEGIVYPSGLDDYLSLMDDPVLHAINNDAKMLFHAIQGTDVDELISTYKSARALRSAWGTAYHYISFVKL
jgi:SAM-dependent methyltransferase